MKKLLVVLAFGLVLALAVPTLLAGNRTNPRAQDTPVTCVWNFEATVRQGPNTGTNLMGDLTIAIDKDGAFTGTLAAQNNQSINVVGQAMGYAVNLGLELQAPASDKKGMYIFGTGTAWQKISADTNCGGNLGGTFAGPQPGDLGDWVVCVKIKRASSGNFMPVSNDLEPDLGSAAC